MWYLCTITVPDQFHFYWTCIIFFILLYCIRYVVCLSVILFREFPFGELYFEFATVFCVQLSFWFNFLKGFIYLSFQFVYKVALGENICFIVTFNFVDFICKFMCFCPVNNVLFCFNL